MYSNKVPILKLLISKQHLKVNNKLPKLKKEIPGILTAFVSSSGSDGNLVSYLEKAVVKLMCGGVYD